MQQQDDEEEGRDDGLRELILSKSNYGPQGERIPLRWQNGVYVPYGGPSTIDRAAAEAPIDHLFLRLLSITNAQGRYVGQSSGRNYAPSKLTAMPEAAGKTSRKGLEAAMERLFAANRIRLARHPGLPPSRAPMVIIPSTEPQPRLL